MVSNDLLSVPAGCGAEVLALHVDGAMRRRLLDLGVTPGARVDCLFAAPSGDPVAYLIRGAVVALRNADAARISVGGAAPWA